MTADTELRSTHEVSIPVERQYFLYRCIWTEYESGWGQRPDGFSYAPTMGILEECIKRVEACGDHAEFSRASDIKIVRVTKELFEEVMQSESKVFSTNRNKDPRELSS